MTSPNPVALILGAGAKVGTATAKAFAANGYKIALAARSLKEEDSTPDQLLVKADFSQPESVVAVFDKVKKVLGLPHVVVYNGACPSSNRSPAHLSISPPPYSLSPALLVHQPTPI